MSQCCITLPHTTCVDILPCYCMYLTYSFLTCTFNKDLQVLNICILGGFIGRTLELMQWGYVQDRLLEHIMVLDWKRRPWCFVVSSIILCCRNLCNDSKSNCYIVQYSTKLSLLMHCTVEQCTLELFTWCTHIPLIRKDISPKLARIWVVRNYCAYSCTMYITHVCILHCTVAIVW